MSTQIVKSFPAMLTAYQAEIARALPKHMNGGEIGIEIGRDFAVRMTGGVTRVGEGTLDPEMLDGAE